jgi:hypothetical protein
MPSASAAIDVRFLRSGARLSFKSGHSEIEPKWSRLSIRRKNIVSGNAELVKTRYGWLRY